MMIKFLYGVIKLFYMATSLNNSAYTLNFINTTVENSDIILLINLTKFL